jgi:hypothetical protein
MTYSTTIAELRRAGVAIRPSEAVAIAQKLINGPHGGPTHPPFGPPSLENVFLDELGSVTCSACAVRPAVSEIAILLDALLPAGMRLPGGLRYTIERALLNVDAPPFDSLEELSTALSRFERGDAAASIRDLIERARATSTVPAPAAVIPFKSSPGVVRFRAERRQAVPSTVAAELRRELRRADLARYAHQASTTIPDFRGALHHHGRSISTIVAGLSAGLMLIASGEAMHRSSPDVATSTPLPAISRPAPHLPEPAMSLPLPMNMIDGPEVRRTPAAGSHFGVSRRAPLRTSSVERSGRSAGTVVTETEARKLRAHHVERTRTVRRGQPTGVLFRLRLQWLRNLITYRHEEL